MSVDVVALLHILQDILVGLGHTLAHQLVVATLGTHLRRCRDEDFQLGIRKYRRANIAAIHHDAALLTHRLLLGHHRRTHERNGGNRAHVVAHLQRANLLLHQFTIQIGVGFLCLGVELKRDADLLHALLQFIGQHGAVFGKQPVAQGEQRHGTIHRTRVNIHISNSLGQVLGHRAFSARGIAVDSNCNFLHRVYCIINFFNLPARRALHEP